MEGAPAMSESRPAAAAPQRQRPGGAAVTKTTATVSKSTSRAVRPGAETATEKADRGLTPMRAKPRAPGRVGGATKASKQQTGTKMAVAAVPVAPATGTDKVGMPVAMPAAAAAETAGAAPEVAKLASSVSSPAPSGPETVRRDARTTNADAPATVSSQQRSPHHPPAERVASGDGKGKAKARAQPRETVAAGDEVGNAAGGNQRPDTSDIADAREPDDGMRILHQPPQPGVGGVRCDRCVKKNLPCTPSAERRTATCGQCVRVKQSCTVGHTPVARRGSKRAPKEVLADVLPAAQVGPVRRSTRNRATGKNADRGISASAPGTARESTRTQQQRAQLNTARAGGGREVTALYPRPVPASQADLSDEEAKARLEAELSGGHIGDTRRAVDRTVEAIHGWLDLVPALTEAYRGSAEALRHIGLCLREFRAYTEMEDGASRTIRPLPKRARESAAGDS